MKLNKIAVIALLAASPMLALAADPTSCPSSLNNVDAQYWTVVKGTPNNDNNDFNEAFIQRHMQSQTLTCYYGNSQDNRVTVNENADNWQTSTHDSDQGPWNGNFCTDPSDAAACTWKNH